VKTLPVTLNGLSDGEIFFFHGYGSEEVKPSGFVPVVIPTQACVAAS
jgi:hypothetical protein